jgi:Zn-dependent M28 family amino/carboxypeptidase
MIPRLTIAVFLSGILFAKNVPQFDGQSWWNHVKVLADDKMAGRETGSEGLRRASEYVVQQLTRAGLQPAGTKGFYQPVSFTARQIVEKDSRAALVRNGSQEPIVLGEDAYFATSIDLSPDEVSAPLVFIGYGLKIPELNLDELLGLDLKNKVVVYVSGSPSNVPSALSAHYQQSGVRWKALHDAGAIGAIRIFNPASMDIPWSRISLNRTHVEMTLADPEFDETAGERMALSFNPAKAEKLFSGSGHSFQEIADLARDRKELPRFPLAVSLKAKARVDKKKVESSNIVAKLPGSDPKLKDEYVVLSAHIDHVGIGEPVDGDRIYNGAMDDGSGDGVLLDIASALKQRPDKLRRSVLFLFVIGEEKGLLGSKYFAAKPTVDIKSMVADINIDMFLPIVPLKTLRILGLDESDLGTRAKDVAQAMKIRPQADPEPLRNSFIRSDQYSFIRRGVPALKADVGFAPGSPEQKTFKDWLTHRYHAPSDDVNQPVDLQAAGLYEQFIYRLLADVANEDERPQWKAESFFRRYAQQGQ